eukprot:1150633-Pelagomonas_calceolata.AAC.2
MVCHCQSKIAYCDCQVKESYRNKAGLECAASHISGYIKLLGKVIVLRASGQPACMSPTLFHSFLQLDTRPSERRFKHSQPRNEQQNAEQNLKDVRLSLVQQCGKNLSDCGKNLRKSQIQVSATEFNQVCKCYRATRSFGSAQLRQMFSSLASLGCCFFSPALRHRATPCPPPL